MWLLPDSFLEIIKKSATLNRELSLNFANFTPQSLLADHGEYF